MSARGLAEAIGWAVLVAWLAGTAGLIDFHLVITLP